MAQTELADFCKESAGISNLPDELLIDIFLRNTYADLCRCARVCRRWNTLAKCIELKKQIIINKPLPHLKFLGLVEHHFTASLEDFRFLPGTISYNTPLTSIASHHLWKISNQCDNLKTLVLVSCSLVSVTLRDFPSSLNHLSIRCCEVNAVPFFGPNPSRFLPHLVCLDIGSVSNYITSPDLPRLNSLKTLKALYMEGCSRINSGGIESIYELLPHLEILDVEGTDISNQGASFIMNNSPKLKKLFIGHTQIDDKVFNEIKRNPMPELNYFCILDSEITSIGLQNFFEDFVTSATVTVKAYPKVIYNFELRVKGCNYKNPSKYPVKFLPSRSLSKCEHYLSHKY